MQWKTHTYGVGHECLVDGGGGLAALRMQSQLLESLSFWSAWNMSIMVRLMSLIDDAMDIDLRKLSVRVREGVSWTTCPIASRVGTSNKFCQQMDQWSNEDAVCLGLGTPPS